MPHPNSSDDLYSSNSHFLAVPGSSSRKSASRQSLSARRSTASLRSPSGLSQEIEDESANGRHHSLAHELAVALMPEPSAGSKLLAEEFGIEFDEGAEGIDEAPAQDPELNVEDLNFSASSFADPGIPSFASELINSAGDASFHDQQPTELDEPLNGDDFDPSFHTQTAAKNKVHQKKPEQDAMEMLAQDLESTDKFLNHLRTIDIDPGSTSQHVPALERIASDVIRRMNVSVRDREGHVRELLEYDREFRKIAGELGGSDVLGQLDELTYEEDLSDRPEPSKTELRHLDTLYEEPKSPRSPITRYHSHTSDWEVDPDRRLGDEDDASEPALSPIKDTFIPPPSMNGPATPASAIPQLIHLRSFTTSLLSSLSTISEQAQVNGAATAEAGRKIRALKNRLGGWRTEWDSAERSRVKIERWEAGIVDGDGEGPEGSLSPVSPTRSTTKRIDGRRIVEEHLRAFELALADAALKTQAIMAR